MSKKIIIRFATIKDLPFIVNIYNQAIRSKCATGDIKEFQVNERVEWFNNFNSNSYPLYIAETQNTIVGYCSISPYRPGRQAMFKVAEISYYVDYNHHNRGIGTKLMRHVINDCERIGKDHLLAILLDINVSTIKILNKFNFKKLGHLPNIIQFEDKKCGHFIYGLNLLEQ